MATMRKVPLKSIDTEDAKFTYKEILLQLLKAPKNPQAGATVEEMEVALPIRAAIKAAGDHVLLSEEQWADLDHRMVHVFKPSMNAEEILTFIKDVRGAPKVDVAEVQS